VAGVALAMVLDALCVLAVPPLTLGWTLISGFRLMVGEKLMIAVAIARSCPDRIRPWPWPEELPGPVDVAEGVGLGVAVLGVAATSAMPWPRP
jgi:hypothetical protein